MLTCRLLFVVVVGCDDDDDDEDDDDDDVIDGIATLSTGGDCAEKFHVFLIEMLIDCVRKR